MDVSAVLDDTRQETKDGTDNGVRPIICHQDDTFEEFL